MKNDNLSYRIRRWCHALCLSLLVTPFIAQADLAELQVLKQNNALQLAVKLIDQQQPDVQTDTPQWMVWEKERLQIYTLTANWSALIKRTNTFPENIGQDFLLYAKNARVKAMLSQQQSKSARQVLQSLIWSSSSQSHEQKKQWLPVWRRQVIETYLEQGLLEDAYTAEQRYHQDYGLLNEEDRLLRARILLLNNHVDEAATLLSKHTKDPQAGMLYLIAQLRGSDRTPKKVLQAAFRQLRGKWVDESLKHRLWAVIAEAARISGDRYATVNALEHLVALVTPQQLPHGLFKNMDADGLWQAYADAASQLGNHQQLLIGDDKKWFKYANEIDAKDPLKGRALYAFIILNGQEINIVNQAAAKFMHKVETIDAYETLVKALFLQSQHYATAAAIPLPVRHTLVDIALKDSDIPMASRLMATMDNPPEGVDKFMWQLRRARILVIGGNIDKGHQLMLKLLAENKKLDRQTLDRYLQVVFDLQARKAHDEAVELFEHVINYVKDVKLQRELYFWMADSRKAQENFIAAARWYLKSAMLTDPKAMDPWAQASRYHAANVLAKAGLVDDARKMYQNLLRVTEDKSRVAVLERELQQLKLAAP